MWHWNLKLFHEDFGYKYIFDKFISWKPIFSVLQDNISKVMFWEQSSLRWSAFKLWLFSLAEPTREYHCQVHQPSGCAQGLLSVTLLREKKASWPCAAPQGLGTWSPLFPVSFSSGSQTSCPHLRAACCSESFGCSVAASCSVPGSWPVAPADCEVSGPHGSNSSCCPTWLLPVALTIFRNN